MLVAKSLYLHTSLENMLLQLPELQAENRKSQIIRSPNLKDSWKEIKRVLYLKDFHTCLSLLKLRLPADIMITYLQIILKSIKVKN